MSEWKEDKSFLSEKTLKTRLGFNIGDEVENDQGEKGIIDSFEHCPSVCKAFVRVSGKRALFGWDVKVIKQINNKSDAKAEVAITKKIE